MTLRIAFYGKGGIGKSTIATNVSALLAKKGMRVLHIGCDPKADSTRLLTKRKIPTVLSQLDTLDDITRNAVVFEGACGVQCVETGGPEAGTGCAGLGIMTAMDELKRLGVFDESWDVIVYDVLGDVVCGGFSVPMRKHFVDKVYVVTSSYYMSLYAANNILKGIKRYARAGNGLCGGIIGNHIKDSKDEKALREFCRQVKVPCATVIEDDITMQKADYYCSLFALENENCKNSNRIKMFVDNLTENPKTCLPKPLNTEHMEKFGIMLWEKIYEREYNN